MTKTIQQLFNLAGKTALVTGTVVELYSVVPVAGNGARSGIVVG